VTFSASTYANFVSRASIAHERLFLLRRSSMFPGLPGHAKALVGRGLTDHPTSNEITTYVTAIDNVPIPKSSHAKIIFYSRGLRDGGRIRFPFNVEGQAGQRVPVLEEPAHRQRRKQIAVEVEVAVEVGHRDRELVQRPERRHPGVVGDGDREGRLADQMRPAGAGGVPDRERTQRGLRVRPPPAAQRRHDRRHRSDMDQRVAPGRPRPLDQR
jgi:hypothetical protein